MAVNSSLNIAFAIGTTASATNQTEFEADTYVACGEVEDIGEFGPTYNPVNFTALADGIVRKFKGTLEPGTVTIVLGMDNADSGQDALETALANTGALDFNFKVTFNDYTTPTVTYFKGKVMSRRYQTGGADSIVRIAVDIAINSNPLEIQGSNA